VRVLLLGVGMQGQAALYDLQSSKAVTEIIAADLDPARVQAQLARARWDAQTRIEQVDAGRRDAIDRLMKRGPDVAIALLPVAYHDVVASSAVEHRVHLVNASYATSGIKALSDKAMARGVTILPEFGMDPGIDLVLLGQAVRSLDRLEEITTYGAGFPEPEAATNALRYKVTWRFAGVLNSYYRAARVIRGGRVIEIAGTELFRPEYCHEIEIEGLGKLEAFPNGDASKYATLLGLDTSVLRNMGRYVLRWPGHCAFWRTLVDLGFLDDDPLAVDGAQIDRKRYLQELIEPRIQYGANERDVVVIRVEAAGVKAGAPRKVIYQVIDHRDLETGLTAMSRTVGFTASIGAQMIGSGQIRKRGLLSPVEDVPYEPFVQELHKRHIRVTSESL
jgi:lysine 6-dehydrogenase